MIKKEDFVDCMVHKKLACEKIKGKRIKELWLVFDVENSVAEFIVETDEEIFTCDEFVEAIDLYNEIV